MIDILSSSYFDLLPPNFKQDKEVVALFYAFDESLKQFEQTLLKTYIWSSIKNISHSVADFLAAELRTYSYKTTLPLDIKREMIAKTLIWYSLLGTKGVIKDVLNTTFGHTEVMEWFEYGGEPYFFKVILKNVVINKNDFQDIIRIIYELKNSRSWLDKLSIESSVRQDVYVGHVLRRKITCQIDWIKVVRSDKHPIFVGFGIKRTIKNRINLYY